MASHPDTVAAKQRLPDMTAIPVMRREGYYIVVLVVRTVSHLRAQAYRPQPGARGSGDLGTGSCRSLPLEACAGVLGRVTTGVVQARGDQQRGALVRGVGVV